MTYARRTLVGPCVGAALLLAALLFGGGPVVVHSAAASEATVSPPAVTGDDFTVQTLEDVAVVPAPPLSVAAIGGLALVLAAGWHLRHDWRRS
jgi:hypothetical protein